MTAEPFEGRTSAIVRSSSTSRLVSVLAFAALVGAFSSSGCGGKKGDIHAEKTGPGDPSAKLSAKKSPPLPPPPAFTAPPIASLENLALSSPEDPRVAAGARSYARYCALCHGNDAKGYAADHAPSLVNPTFLASASDDFLLRSIRGGRPGTAMAGYGRDRGGPMTDTEMAALIAFLRAQGPAYVEPAAVPAPGNAARGQGTYDATCKRCHGTPEFRADFVHLGNPAFLASSTDAFLRHAIVEGRPGTPMVSFKDTLDAGQIDDVVALLRSWGPAAPPAAVSVVAPPIKPPAELGPVLINPKGGNPSFALRENRFVPIDLVKKALDAKKKMVIIDARATSDWLVMRIPGSVSIPYYELQNLAGVPNDDTWVLAYCACPHHASGVIVDELRKRGYKHTAILDEGILEWDKRKYPVARQSPGAGASGSSAAPGGAAPKPHDHPH